MEGGAEGITKHFKNNTVHQSYLTSSTVQLEVIIVNMTKTFVIYIRTANNLLLLLQYFLLPLVVRNSV